jgi:prevent-host-death family protein
MATSRGFSLFDITPEPGTVPGLCFDLSAVGVPRSCYDLTSLSRTLGVVVAWQLQAAKQHFSELVERARRDGPQVVTKHGKDAVVVVSAEEYQRLRRSGPSLVEFIRSAPNFDLLDLERVDDHGRDVQL